MLTPAVTQIGATQQGTDTSAGTVNFASVAISGLTNRDVLRVLVTMTAVGNTANVPVIYNATDNVAMLTHTTSLADGVVYEFEAVICVSAHSNTAVHTRSVRSTGTTVGLISQATTVTTNFTGNWTLATRYAGINAGGTLHYTMRVYKIAG